VLDDETMVDALRACVEGGRTIARDQSVWFEALCVLEQLAKLVGSDRRRFGELREPLGEWIERHGRFADDPGVRSELEGPGSMIRYIVLTERVWAQLQDQSQPPSAA
jgi:hypothetical protein